MKLRCFILFFLMSAFISNAADIELSDFSYNIISIENLTVEVVAYNTTSKDVHIPSTVEYSGRTFSVKKIADKLFYQNWTIEQVSIPKSIEIIGSNAFWGCSNLKKLIIEDGENDILLNYEHYSLQPAFDGCSNLTTLYMGRNISFETQYIQASPFYNCTSLESVEVTSNVTIIPHYMFYHCKGLKRIILPNSVNTIGVRAFAECNNLQEVVLSSELKAIRWSAFEDCTSLHSIVLPSHLESIDRDAFRNTALTVITIPASVQCIEGGAFFGSKLESLIIEDSSEPIRMPKHSSQYSRNQFNYTNLTNVYLGRNIDYQENEAYSKEGLFPYTLNHIEFSNYVSKINPFLFSYTHLKDIELVASITSIGRNAFQNSTIENIVIPETILSIDSRAFLNCTNIISVIFYGEDVEIANSVFEGCASLKSVKLPTKLKQLPAACFANCSSLETIELPESLTTIGGSAFKNCICLSELEFPNELEVIGIESFHGCSSLNLLKLGNNINEIGGQSFADCPINNIILLNENPPIVQINTFDNKVYLNAVLYVPEVAISNYANADGWKNFGTIKNVDDFISGVYDITTDENVLYTIYDLQGKVINGKLGENNIPAGIYIFKQGLSTKKILVK